MAAPASARSAYPAERSDRRARWRGLRPHHRFTRTQGEGNKGERSVRTAGGDAGGCADDEEVLVIVSASPGIDYAVRAVGAHAATSGRMILEVVGPHVN